MSESIPLIPMGESSRRVIVFMLELLKGQPLSPTFTNPDIMVGMCMNIQLLSQGVFRGWMGETLLVFAEGENIEK